MKTVAVAVIGTVSISAALTCSDPVEAQSAYITGEIEDGGAQVIQMPRLRGQNSRQIAWMAPEGSYVEVGDLVMTIDPADLQSQKDSRQVQLEDTIANAEAQKAQQELNVFDAETALIRAVSQVKLAELDAKVPKGTIPDLTYERNQLSLVNALNSLKRAMSSLDDAKTARDKAIPVREQQIAQAEGELDEIDEAIANTEVFATQPGMLIYATLMWTGEKIFPGGTYIAGLDLAYVASKADLQFRFWVHEADIRKVAVDSELSVTPDSLPELTVNAKVTWKSSQANTKDWSDGGYFEVIANPTQPIPEQFLPGMAVVGEVLN